MPLPLSAESPQNYPLDFQFAYGAPQCRAVIRTKPEFFIVDELRGFELSGEGEHVYLQLEKTGLNTDFLAQQLARIAAVRKLDVGYAGLKDRQAVTTQWFSLYLPGKSAPNWSQLEDVAGVKLLRVDRHTQKLRRGQHSGNRFRLRLTDFAGDRGGLSDRLNKVAEQGVPNYFGPQRFGIEGNNLTAADQMLRKLLKPRGRHLKGIYLSAARSYLFNLLLSRRVAEGSWASVEPGDVVYTEPRDGRTVPTGPLWGRGRINTELRIAELENELAGDHPEWCHGLEHSGLQQQRRPLCLSPEALQWCIEPDGLELEFVLPPGAYATSLIRELCVYEDMARLKVAERRGMPD